MQFLRTILITLAICNTPNLNAALIDFDTYTTDTDSGLDWLDLTLTDTMSYNDVTAQMVVGGTYEGWQYATHSQLFTFFTNAGISVIDSSFPGGPEATALLNLWGVTTDTGASIYLTGEIDLLAPNAHIIGTIDPLFGTSLFAIPVDDNQAIFDSGSALVRVSVVPVPAAAWLFGSGLIALAGLAKTRKR